MTWNTTENRKVLNCILIKSSTQHTAGTETAPLEGECTFSRIHSGEAEKQQALLNLVYSEKHQPMPYSLGPDTLWAQKCGPGDNRKVEGQQMNFSCTTSVNAWPQLCFERKKHHQYFLTAPARKEASHCFSVQVDRKILHKHSLVLLHAIQKPYINILRQ